MACYASAVDDQLASGQRVAAISLGVNGGLGLIKLVAGIVGNSYALVADAVESLGDLFSSSMVWGGLVIARKPADANHPYGHGKAEPLAALGVALMLIAAAVGIAIKAVDVIRTPHASPAVFTLPVLLVVVFVKEWMFRYGSHVGHRIRSLSVSADAWHHRSDALTSAVAAVGITVALIGGEAYAAADEYAALVACLVIAANGVRFARVAVWELMDTSPGAALAASIEETARQVDGARGIEKLQVRKMGPSLYVDLHLEVDPDLTVLNAHAVAHAVKDRIMSARHEVADVLIHIEPHAPRATDRN